MSRNCLIVLGAILLTSALISGEGANCPAGGCGASVGDWDSKAQEFLSTDVPLVGVSPTDSAKETSFKAGDAVKNIAQNETVNVKVNDPQAQDDNAMSDAQPAYRSDLFPKGEFLKAMPSVSSSDLVLDVSNSRAQGEARIRNTISIPLKSFLYDNDTVKPITEISKTLGDAGISSDDPVVVYSDTFDSGKATFVFWLMRYLGHENVKVLDGDLHSWTAASLPLDIKQNTRHAVSYSANVNADLMAEYEYVKSGTAQIVDARSFQDFGKERIPLAFSVRPDDVLEDGKIKDAAKLNDTFSMLDKSRPVVVYSSDIVKASLVWYALQLMGFDSRMYTWQDWQAHEAVSSG